MKQKKGIALGLIFFSVIVLVIGCSENGGNHSNGDLRVEGYILEKEGNRILVAEDITSEKYENIKDKSIPELDKKQVSLIYLGYDNPHKLSVGAEIVAQINDGIDQSYPAQAEAKDIKVKD